MRTCEGPTGEPFFLPESVLTLTGLEILLGGELQGQWGHVGCILSPALSGDGKEESEPEVDCV